METAVKKNSFDLLPRFIVDITAEPCLLHLTDLICWCLFVCVCVCVLCTCRGFFVSKQRIERKDSKGERLQFDPDCGIRCQLNPLPPSGLLLPLTFADFLSCLSSSSSNYFVSCSFSPLPLSSFRTEGKLPSKV